MLQTEYLRVTYCTLSVCADNTETHISKAIHNALISHKFGDWRVCTVFIDNACKNRPLHWCDVHQPRRSWRLRCQWRNAASQARST